jgi:hypothetical protein
VYYLIQQGDTTMQSRIRKIRLNDLQQEGGVTDVSISNALLIDYKGYYPVIVCHEADYDKAIFHTKVYYKKNGSDQLYYFIYSGFSSGYYGEGSRGFADFLFTIAGINLKYDDTLDLLAKKLKSNHRYVFALDKDFDELIHVRITKGNITKLDGSQPIKLVTNVMRLIKNWDVENTIKTATN